MGGVVYCVVFVDVVDFLVDDVGCFVEVECEDDGYEDGYC